MGPNFVRYLYGAPLALGMLAFLVFGTAGRCLDLAALSRAGDDRRRSPRSWRPRS